MGKGGHRDLQGLGTVEGLEISWVWDSLGVRLPETNAWVVWSLLLLTSV